MPKWCRVQQPWRKWDIEALRKNLGVYVHIPFCLARCGYCDFLTYGAERPSGLDFAPYHDTLLSEITRRGEWVSRHYGSVGRVVDTVFIGGGTPTCQQPENLCEQIKAIRRSFNVAPDSEFTVEANPDTLTPDYVARLAKAGVNRLSVGIQSTQTRTLRFMDRTHRWDDILPVLQTLRNGPIKRFSFDLIYGVPGQTTAMLKESIQRLLSLGPEHISAYELTCEEGTPYHRWSAMFAGQLATPEQVIRQRRVITRALAGRGLYRYEVSNYARPGAECRHNLRYWHGGDYIGLGLGAASRIGTEVINNPREVAEYQVRVDSAGSAGDPLVVAAGDVAPGHSPPADTFMQLRTRLGMEHPPSLLPQEWFRNGWVRHSHGRLEVTSAGLDFADLLSREL